MTNQQYFITKNTAVNFLVRDCGFTFDEAEFEVSILLFAAGKIVRTKESYLMVSRIGAPKLLNREERLSVYMSFENALNHTTF